MPYRVDPNTGQKVQPGAQQAPGGGLGGGDNSDLKKMLIMSALKDPKNASKYNTILNMIQPSASEMKAKDKMEALKKEENEKLLLIDESISLLKRGIRTGPLPGRWLAMKSKWGVASDDEQKLYSNISEIGAEKMFDIGGKVLPRHEKQLLEAFSPSANVANEMNITNLEKMRRELVGQYQTESTGQRREAQYTNKPYYPDSWQTQQ